MNTFGQILIGTEFIFKGRTYTKTDEMTAVSLRDTSQKVHYFMENEKIEVKNN